MNVLVLTDTKLAQLHRQIANEIARRTTAVVAVARTIANLDRSEWIKPSHICEAINYRMLRRAQVSHRRLPSVLDA
jgi:predicted ATPase with chaperone activity